MASKAFALVLDVDDTILKEVSFDEQHPAVQKIKYRPGAYSLKRYKQREQAALAGPLPPNKVRHAHVLEDGITVSSAVVVRPVFTQLLQKVGRRDDIQFLLASANDELRTDAVCAQLKVAGKTLAEWGFNVCPRLQFMEKHDRHKKDVSKIRKWAKLRKSTLLVFVDDKPEHLVLVDKKTEYVLPMTVMTPFDRQAADNFVQNGIVPPKDEYLLAKIQSALWPQPQYGVSLAFIKKTFGTHKHYLAQAFTKFASATGGKLSRTDLDRFLRANFKGRVRHATKERPFDPKGLFVGMAQQKSHVTKDGFMHWCDENLNMHDLLEHIIIPRVGRPSVQSYVEACGAVRDMRSVGPATHFVSYGWGTSLCRTIDALDNHPAINEAHFLFLDSLLIPQALPKELEPPTQWFSTVFFRSVASKRHFVQCMFKWNKPHIMTRAWCMWELLAAQEACHAAKGSDFNLQQPLLFALPTEDKTDFEAALKSKGANHVEKIINALDIEKEMTATKREDEQMIRQAIKGTTFALGYGFHGLNAAVKKALRDWITQTGEELLKSYEAMDGGNPDKMLWAASMYQHVGYYAHKQGHSHYPPLHATIHL